MDTLQAIAPYVATQDSEAILEYFAAQACAKTKVQNQEACVDAVLELIKMAQEAGSVEQLASDIQSALQSNEELQAMKQDLQKILDEVKRLVMQEGVASKEDLQNLAKMIADFAKTYGDVVRFATTVATYGCPHTKAPEACKVIIEDLLIGYSEGQNPETVLKEIASDLKNLAITSIPSVHEQIILALTATADTMLLEKDFISIRYSTDNPEQEVTSTVFDQGVNAMTIHINDLNAIYAEMEPIFSNPTEENLDQLPALVEKYAMEMIEVGKSYQQFLPPMRGGVGYISNFQRNEYLNVSHMTNRDLVKLLLFYQENNQKDTSTVRSLIDHEPTTYRQVGQATSLTTPSGNTYDINPKLTASVPTDAGILQMIRLSQDELSQANELWKTVILQGKNSLSSARIAQGEFEIYLNTLRQQKIEMAKELCRVLNSKSSNCNTNAYETLEAIANGASHEEVVAIFCQNKPNPTQCQELKNIVTAAIDEANSVEELYNILKDNLQAPVTQEQMQARVEEIQTLLAPLRAYIEALLAEEGEDSGLDSEEIMDLIFIIVDIVEQTENGQTAESRTSDTLCNGAETEEEQQACREVIKTVILMKQEGASQEEIMAYLLTQVDSVEEIQKYGDEIVQFVKLSLYANRITADLLENREGDQSIGVKKLREDYNELYPLYVSLEEAYKKMTEEQNQITIAEYVVIMEKIIVIMNDHYTKDLEAGMYSTAIAAEAHYMKKSEIFGYDTFPVLQILSDIYKVAIDEAKILAQQILDDSRSGKSMVTTVQPAWGAVFYGSQENYDSAQTAQTALNKLIKKITQEKAQLLAEIEAEKDKAEAANAE